MDDLIRIEANKNPYVFLDQNNGIIELKGSSYMEDTISFYNPIIKWVNEYVRSPKDTSIIIDIEFFNTSSAKLLLMIIKTFSKIQKSGHRLTVYWLYNEDDDKIRDSGLNFSRMSNVKFILIKKTKSMVIEHPELENEK